MFYCQYAEYPKRAAEISVSYDEYTISHSHIEKQSVSWRFGAKECVESLEQSVAFLRV